MKKLLVFGLCAMLALCVCSCDSKDDTVGNAANQTVDAPLYKPTIENVMEKSIEKDDDKPIIKNEKNPIVEDAAADACGENLTWSFDSETKVLTISGSGDMWDFVYFNEDTGSYSSTPRPWSNCQYKVENIVISDGVTSIGDHAFWDFRSVKSVSIPNSVKRIGLNAFSECYVLTSIKIPQGVTKIETITFDNCYKLSNIEIPDSVTSIGDRAFEDCNDLTSIYIPASVISIGKNLFNKCVNNIEIHFGGTEQQWEALNFTADNADKITVVFNK